MTDYEYKARRWLTADIFDSNAKVQAHVEQLSGWIEDAEKYRKFINAMQVSQDGRKFAIDTVVSRLEYDGIRDKNHLAGRLWVRVEKLIKELPDNWTQILFSMFTYLEATE